ncbi:MAG TPA: hypothetical protein VGI83_00200, partial [Gemmatimonadales bacterium]
MKVAAGLAFLSVVMLALITARSVAQSPDQGVRFQLGANIGLGGHENVANGVTNVVRVGPRLGAELIRPLGEQWTVELGGAI